MQLLNRLDKKVSEWQFHPTRYFTAGRRNSARQQSLQTLEGSQKIARLGILIRSLPLCLRAQQFQTRDLVTDTLLERERTRIDLPLEVTAPVIRRGFKVN